MKNVLTFLALIFASFPCTAQWRDIGLGNPGGSGANLDVITSFGVHDTSLFMSLEWSNGPQHLYRYIPTKGRIEADTGIDFSKGNLTSFASLGAMFFAGIPARGCYRTTNNGSNWQPALGTGPICGNGTYCFAVAYNQAGPFIVRSRDGHTPWDSLADFTASRFATQGAIIFASASGSVYRSTDTGTSWTQFSAPLQSAGLALLDSVVFEWSGYAYRSLDLGAHWSKITLNRSFNTMVTTGTYVFAGTDSGVFVSLDSGVTWRGVSDGLGANLKTERGWLNVTQLCVFDTMLFAGIDVGNNYEGDGTARPISEMVQEAKSAVQQPAALRDTIAIYPNPATGLVTILVRGTAILRVSVLNVLGVEVLAMPSPRESEITLDLSHLPSGTYFVRIEAATGNVLRKVVRE